MFTLSKISFFSNIFLMLSFQRIPEYFTSFIYTFQDELQKLIKIICSSNTILQLAWERENTKLHLTSSKMSNSSELKVDRRKEHRCSDQKTSQERLKRLLPTRHFIESTQPHCSVNVTHKTTQTLIYCRVRRKDP